MKLSWPAFLLLLIIAVAAPIVVVELVYFSEPKQEQSPEGPVSPAEPRKGERSKSPRELPSEPVEAKVTNTSGTVAEPGTPEVHVGRERPHEFRGVLHGFSGIPVADAELVLKSADQNRPVWTGPDGAFAFVLSPSAFPATLETESGELLFRAESAPEDYSTRVNVTTMAPSNALGGLLGARAVSFTKGSSADECLIQARGSTKLPPDTRLVVRLLAGGDKIIQETLFFYGGGDLIGEIRFPFGELYSGRYKLQLAWKVISAPADVVSQFRSVLPDPLPGEVPARMYLPVFLGDPDAAANEERRVTQFYEAALTQLELSRDLVLWIGSAVHGEERDFDKDYRETLKRHPALVRVGGVGRKGSFKLDRWRSLIDTELPTLWKLHRSADVIPFPEKYPARSQSLQLAFEQLHKLMRLESRLIYRKLNKSPDRKDYVDFDFAIESEHPVTEQRLADFLRAIRRDIRRAQ